MNIPHTSNAINIKTITIHAPSVVKKVALFSLALMLYAIAVPYAYQTMGEPLRRAIEQAEILKNNATLVKAEGGVEVEEAEVGSEILVSWDDEEAKELKEQEEELQKILKAAEEKRKEEEGAENATKPVILEEERPLPSAYLPDAGAVFLLFMVVTLHALFHLMCRWFVWFRAMFLFDPATSIKDGCFAQIIPHEHRGVPALAEIKLGAQTNSAQKTKLERRFEFWFQKQKYEYVPPGEDLGEDEHVAAETEEEVVKEQVALEERRQEVESKKLTRPKTVSPAKTGIFRLVLARADEPISQYCNAKGLLTVEQVQEQLQKFGPNSLSSPVPPIADILLDQLLSPLAIFQFFSAGLWMLDEYWQYTMFSLLSIFMLEGGTAFQRHRTLNQLKGLSPKPYNIFVYRGQKWLATTTENLLPGDIISLCGTAQRQNQQIQTIPSEKDNTKKTAAESAPVAVFQIGSDVVPCDCILLKGNAVVNEASLTGESVPQMKDAIRSSSKGEGERNFDLNGLDRVHTLFSGTTLIACTNVSGSNNNQIPPAPDNGCVCLVLRTGFGSSQGELMQMIEFSTQKVSADSKETGVALLILLTFALASSAYVFKRGLEKGDRTTHELLLKCVIIITSVVPRQLPVQMSLAVNHALMTLMKEGVFCTEPYRVPQAGKITHCLFDKTGTLTTDELVPVGVVNASEIKASSSGSASAASKKASHLKNLAELLLVDMKQASPEATMVLAACHSLVAIPQQQASQKTFKLIGDPIELAAMRGIRWRYDAETQTSFPGDWMEKIERVDQVKKNLEEARKVTTKTPTHVKIVEDLEKQVHQLEEAVAAAKALASSSEITSIRIVQRFHFASKLQRMSVVCKARRKQHRNEDETVCLVKGSPEALWSLLDPSTDASLVSKEEFDLAYRNMAERGMRVLALAYKVLSAKDLESINDRDQMESNLRFAGFVSFECKIRDDSPIVIHALREANHFVSMVTGDAPLTALHVARVCGICTPLLSASNRTQSVAYRNGPPLTLTKISDSLLTWSSSDGSVSIPLDTSKTHSDAGLAELAKSHDLVLTEENLLLAIAQTEGRIWEGVENIAVFARMSPQGKARVIRALQKGAGSVIAETLPGKYQKALAKAQEKEQTKFVLMCGDGGNDVGALKQADVGLALLSGYGNANASSSDASQTPPEEKSAEDALNESELQLQARLKKNTRLRDAELKVKREALMAKQKQMMDDEMEAMKRRGEELGVMSMFQITKKVAVQIQEETAKEQRLLDQKYGLVSSTVKKDPNNEDPLAALDEAGTVPVIRPGDASVAAPFTSRIPSIRSVIHLVRQGRCTLLSALQQQQIMMLECTITAYVYAAISLEGARSSERQMMASGWLIMTASLAFSYSTPIEKMHPVRPLRSLFHPAIAISILGQALIHLYAMTAAVRLATDAMGPEKLAEVVAFNKRVRLGTQAQVVDEDDPLAQVMSLWAQPFLPSLMNSVIFLVETAQIMGVMLVNYKGRPWMKGISENHALFLSLFICVGGIIFLAWEMNPQVNKMIHLKPFPNDEFRWHVLFLVFACLFGTFIWDRAVTAIFAPEVFGAMMGEAKKTTPADLVPILVTLGKVALGFFIFATGNPIIWFCSYWAWRQYSNRVEAEREARILGNT